MTAEEFKEWFETEEGRKIVQPHIDKAVTKGIQTYRENHLSEGSEAIITEYSERVDKLATAVTRLNAERQVDDVVNEFILDHRDTITPAQIKLVKKQRAATPDETRENLIALKEGFRESEKEIRDSVVRSYGRSPEGTRQQPTAEGDFSTWSPERWEKAIETGQAHKLKRKEAYVSGTAASKQI